MKHPRARSLLGLVVAACTAAEPAPQHPAYQTGQIARSAYGMVVSGSPLATEVGVLVLERGGNAVDAAIATAFALAVVEPTMSGLGGRTQILLRTQAGAFVGIDGTTEVPATAPTVDAEDDEDIYGYATVGVPGTVAALVAAHAAHGSRPLAELVAPATRLAERGFVLPAEEAARLAGVADRLREFAGSRRYFLRADGTPYAAGDRLVQRDLARTLRAIADSGAHVFYRGWIAERMAADMVAQRGLIRAADLAAYEAQAAPVVRGSYRGYDLIGTYLPASGATTIEALHILERFDLDDRTGGPEWAALVAQALLLAFEDRTAELGPPAEHAATLVSKTWAARRAAAVRDPRAALPAVAATSAADETFEAEHTTHLSVADRDGGLVALTQSLGPTMGSKVAAPELGFVYAATMGYLGRLAPGDRPFSSQSPLIVMQGSEPAFVLGAAGARRIISAVVAVTSRLVDERLPLADAMAAPRLHPTPQVLYMEGRPDASWTADDLARLADFGFTAEPRASAPYFARIHGIAFDTMARAYVGVADSRWSGTARGPRRGTPTGRQEARP